MRTIFGDTFISCVIFVCNRNEQQLIIHIISRKKNIAFGGDGFIVASNALFIFYLFVRLSVCLFIHFNFWHANLFVATFVCIKTHLIFVGTASVAYTEIKNSRI